MNTPSSESTDVPQAIAAYQAAHDQRDVVTALRQFAPDATVIDDGHSYDGIVGVETFLRSAASEYTFTRTLVAAEEVNPDHWLVTNHLAGDFPGGEVDLNYEFRLAGGLITQLTIAP